MAKSVLVKCYECGGYTPLDDAILVRDNPDDEIDELVNEGLVVDDGERGDFYVCTNCERRMLNIIEEIFREQNVRWN